METGIEFIPLSSFVSFEIEREQERKKETILIFFHCFFEFGKRRKWKCLRPLSLFCSFLFERIEVGRREKRETRPFFFRYVKEEEYRMKGRR